MTWREWLIFPVILPLAIILLSSEWIAVKLIDWAWAKK